MIAKLKYAIYFALALAVLSFALAPGFIFALDMVWTPRLLAPGEPSPGYVLRWFLYIANVVVSAETLQKILLFSCLAFAGIGAHRLAELFRFKNDQKAWLVGCYFAGIFYVLNPFVYSRFMAGQYLVLLGYALLPFFVRSFVMFLRTPSWRQALSAAMWFVAVCLASVHMAGMAVIIAAVFVAVFFWQKQKDFAWSKQVLVRGAVMLGVVTVANSYWLVPAFLGRGMVAQTVSTFTTPDLAAFATNPTGFGLLGNVLSLQGFWADSKSLYLVAQDVFSWWWLPFVGLWALVVFGVYKSWRMQRGITTAFLALIIIGAVLAIGTAGTFLAPFNQWLVDYVPFFAGYREPQKFVALIALAYAYFGAVAVAALAEYARPWVKSWAPATVLPLFAIPLLIAPLILGGFYGQLSPKPYPADWFALNTYLQSTNPKATVLFLPWHMYMRFNFAGRVIASPADKFFKNPVIISSDPEMDGAKSYASSPTQEFLQTQALPAAKAGGTQFAKDLQSHNIRYVLLAKEFDHQKYDFLNAQPGLTQIKDSPTLRLYEVTN